MNDSTVWPLARWDDRRCLGTPIELWFGPPDDAELPELPGERARRERWALQICRTCPVTASCLADELRRGITHQWGVRGGLTAEQRKTAFRQREDTRRTA